MSDTAGRLRLRVGGEGAARHPPSRPRQFEGRSRLSGTSRRDVGHARDRHRSAEQGPVDRTRPHAGRLVAAIRRDPALVDSHIDPQQIILVGHSFGATAVSAALAEGAAVSGAVLLDPAESGASFRDRSRSERPRHADGRTKRSGPRATVKDSLSIRSARHRQDFDPRCGPRRRAKYPTERPARAAGPAHRYQESQITFVTP